MKKLFSLLTLALLTLSAVAGNYVKVTSTAGLTDGTYLIVYEDGGVAFDGSLTTLDAVSNTVNVTVDNGVISSTDAINAATFTIDMTAGTIMSASGYYIGQTANDNGLKTSQTEAYTNTITIDNEGNADIVSSGNARLRYNSASNQLRFRYYKSSSYANQKAIQLYKYEDGTPVVGLMAPVFTPNGGEFSGSIEVTVSCPTDNASIYVYKVIDGEIDYTTGEYYFQSGTFFVNETMTYAAYAYKGDDYTDYTYATFTKVTPTCATPTFNPASGATFMQGEMLSVEISSATEGAEIWYTVNGEDFYGTTPVTVPVDETTTITAFASKEGYYDSPEATATYTMLLPYNVGGTATFVAETDTVEGGATAGWHTLVKDNVTMKFYGTVSNYTDNNGNEYHEYRIYKNNPVEFTTEAGNIRKIEFTCSSSNPITGFKPVDGLDMTTGIWQGSTRDITFTAENKQVRATQIVVTLDDQIPTVMAPTFDPNGGYFNAEQEVTITCETEGAKIYYSYDNEQFEEYTAPITINEACTIYAYAIADGVQSETVSATFTQRTLAMNIDEANHLANNTYFYFGGEAIVTYQNSGNTWIKDGTGYGLIYGNQVPDLPQGTVLKEGWDAQKATYNTFPEFKFPNNVEASEDVVTVTPNEYATVTTANVHEYIIMKNQALTLDENDTTGLTWLNVDELKFYNKFGVELNIEEGKNYDVVGVVTIFKNAPEVYIISATEAAPAGLRGDVNKDGEIDIADVTALIAHVLSKDYTESDTFSPGNADVNFDTVIDIADVTVLINRVLSKSW